MRLKTIAVLVLAALATFASGAKAQTSSTDMAGMDHTGNAPAGTIDGAQTPNEIPDIVAFRLWLTQFDPTKPINLATKVPTLQLSASDTAILTQAIQSHVLQHLSTVNAFNGAVDSAFSADQTGFWNSVYNLNRNTMAGLRIQMSKIGYAQFMEYLNNEKGGMLVSPYDAGLGEVAERNLRERRMFAGNPQGGTSMIANYSSYFAAAPVFPTTTFTDFVSHPGGPLGINWTLVSGNIQVIIGGAAHFVANGTGADSEAYAHYHFPTTKDQIVSVQLGTLPQSGKDSGITVRASTTGETFFDAKFYSYNGQGYILIDQMVNGVDTFQQAYAYTQAVNDTLSIQMVGTHYNVFINNSLINTFSGTAITAGAPGITGVVGGGDLKNFQVQYGYGLQVSTQVSGTTIQGLGVIPSNALHYGVLVNTFGAQGGTVNGAAVYPTAYLVANNNHVFATPMDGTGNTLVTVTVKASVTCNILGASFWEGTNTKSGSWKWNTFEWGALTFGKTTSWVPDGIRGYKINVALNCTPETTPPDNVPLPLFNLIYTHIPYDDWIYSSICTNFLGYINCLTIPNWGFNINVPNPSPQLCTKYPLYVLFTIY